MKTVLVLGLDGAGKTLLVRRLAANLTKNKRSLLDRLAPRSSSSSAASTEDAVNPDTQPTIGVEHSVLPFDSRAAALCEVGAQLLPRWHAYFESCDLWIFVVDLSNAAQLAGAAVEFFAVLSHEDMRRKPKLLLLNKVDAFGTLEDSVLRAHLRLDQLLARPDAGPLAIQKASALTGQHIDQVTKWINQYVSFSPASLLTAPTSAFSGMSMNTTGRLQSSRLESRIHPTTAM